MKFSNIAKFTGIAVLVVCVAAGCQNKKKAAAEAAEKARLEAEAKARAEAEARALAARVFVLSDAATATKGAEFATSAEAYQAALESSVKATPYGATEFALPGASFLFDVERCGLTTAHKELLKAFVDAWKATDRKAVILVEPYAADVKDKEYNRAIAVERANRVEAYLLYLGVGKKQMQVVCPCKTTKFDGTRAEKRCCRISVK